MGRFVFKLPDVGEGTAEAELVAWHVANLMLVIVRTPERNLSSRTVWWASRLMFSQPMACNLATSSGIFRRTGSCWMLPSSDL